MAITQAMLDAERARLGIGESAVVKSEQRAGFDRAIAFLRKHGTPFYGGEVDFTGDYADPFVRVEIPVEVKR